MKAYWVALMIIVVIVLVRGQPSEPYVARALGRDDPRVNVCRDGPFGELGGVLMPTGHADHEPWFDYSAMFHDGIHVRSCDDCPGPQICPECPNHGVTMAVGGPPPGPLGADPTMYEYMTDAPAENLTVGADGGYTRGYGRVCYGAPDNMSPAAVAAMPAVRAAEVGGVSQFNNTGYTMMNNLMEAEKFMNMDIPTESADHFRGLDYSATNYASSLEPDFTTSREAMGACTSRRPLSTTLPKTSPYDNFGERGAHDDNALAKQSLKRGACNGFGGACALGFVSRNSARKPELDRTSTKVNDGMIDYLYKEATQMGIAPTVPADDACVFWGAYGRPYYERC